MCQPTAGSVADCVVARCHILACSASGVYVRLLRRYDHRAQVFMGWFWFIPTFHMPHPRERATDGTTLHLTRKELDFPVGVGANLIDVDVSMEWCPETADVLSPPERVSSTEMEEGKGEPAGVVLPAVTSTEAREIAEAKQAAED